MIEPQLVELSEIRLDGGTQTRAAISEPSVAEYAQDMRDGHQFPAVILFNDGAKMWLADGFHRFHAAARCEFESILAEIRTGTRSDAVKYALGANRSNGLRRSNEDKRRCIQIALDEFPEMSDRAIADLCGVADVTVAQYRPKQLQDSCSSKTPTVRVGKDGKTRRMPVTSSPAPAEPEAPEEAQQDPAPKQPIPRYIPSDGLQYAEMAILNLEKIQANDTQREAAFARVTKWLAKNK